jgi:GNAT superfamily N-acetyltransferase
LVQTHNNTGLEGKLAAFKRMEQFSTRRLAVRDWRPELASASGRRLIEDALRAILTERVLAHLPEPLHLRTVDLKEGVDGQPQSPIAEWMSARAAESDVMLVEDAANEVLIGLLIMARCPADPASGVDPAVPVHGSSAGEADVSPSRCPTTDVDPPELHVGYLLREESWGKGYATELVTGLVSALAGSGPLRLLGGVAKDNNPASARVLQKAGFVHSPKHSSVDTDMFVMLIA